MPFLSFLPFLPFCLYWRGEGVCLLTVLCFSTGVLERFFFCIPSGMIEWGALARAVVLC